jgi:hypothetical protein
VKVLGFKILVLGKHGQGYGVGDGARGWLWIEDIYPSSLDDFFLVRTIVR